MSDRRILYSSAFLRALATGMMGVLLGIHLAKIGLDEAAIGLVISAGLAGAALAALLATLGADRAGRRLCLVVLALVGAAGTAVFAGSSGAIACAAAAFLGMLNGMGRDRGAALVIEQAILPGTVTGERRTSAFAWYNVLQDLGHALGSLMAGLPVLLRRFGGMSDTGSFRGALVGNAALVLVPRSSISGSPRASSPRGRRGGCPAWILGAAASWCGSRPSSRSTASAAGSSRPPSSPSSSTSASASPRGSSRRSSSPRAC